MSNPYESPKSLDASEAGLSADQLAYSNRGLIGHVPAVAILMLVQGILEVLMATMLCVMGPVMFYFMQSLPPQDRPANNPQALFLLSGMYVVMGLLTLSTAVLKIVAFFYNLRFRRRTLGIVALISGVLTVTNCYCAPTGLALMVYGLIVYFNAPVAAAFELGRQGYQPDEIRAVFEM